MSPEQFRETRKHLGMSQKRLAGVLGRSERNVRQWERGERRLDPIAIRFLAQIAQPKTEEGSEDA